MPTTNATRLTTHPFPLYAYVPRMHPHPNSPGSQHFPEGEIAVLARLDSESITQAHFWAIDLFNHGYYWESHEVWEKLWHAFKRQGRSTALVKGLIKLAAAAVKARAGSAIGTRRHANRAAVLFNDAAVSADTDSLALLGMSPLQLTQHCKFVAEQAESLLDSSPCKVKHILPFILIPIPASTGLA